MALAEGAYSANRVLLKHPRFLSELVVIVPLDDGCLIDGSAAIRVVKAKDGYPDLQQIFALLDGSRTTEQLRALLPGISSAFLDSLLAQLSDWDLLEEGIDSTESREISNEETLSFFRRFSHPARNSKERFEKLRASTVVIFARQSTSHPVQTLKTLLENTGVGQVIFQPTESADRWLESADARESAALLVSLSLTGDDREWFSSLAQWCHEKDRSWFRFVVDAENNYADVGPLFDGKSTPCYRCFHDVHGRIPLEKRTNASSYNELFWISLAAAEIVFRLAQMLPLQGPGSFRRYDLKHWGSTTLFNTRVPGCEQCRPGDLAIGDCGALAGLKVTDTALVFEDYIAPKGGDFYYVKDAYTRAHAYEGKELPSCRTHALTQLLPAFERPVLDVMSQEAVLSSGSQLSAKDLSLLLLLSAGIRDSAIAGPEVRRWAPTGGNFGSVEPYLIVRHAEGLLPGFYFYQANEHSLKFFERRRGNVPVDEFMRRALGLGPEDDECLPDALIALTGAFGRLATKYGSFAYKLMNLDAGAAIGQLCLAALGLNIRLRVAPYWADDVIEEQFNLTTIVEQSTALVALSGKVSESIPRSLRTSIPNRRSWRRLQDFSGLAPNKLVEMLYHDSRLREGEISTCVDREPENVISRSDRGKPSLRLPPPLRNSISLREAFSNRRSVRNFFPRPVSLEQLGTMLYLANEFEIKSFPQAECEAESLTLLVFPLQVAGVTQGAYIYDHRGHSLTLLSEIRPGPQYSKIFVQPELAAAPLFVWVTGNLARACARSGAFGHRRLLLRAGAMAHALSIAALGMGLAGTIVAGLVPAGGSDFGLDGFERASLVGFVAGYEKLFPDTLEFVADRFDEFTSIKG